MRTPWSRVPVLGLEMEWVGGCIPHQGRILFVGWEQNLRLPTDQVGALVTELLHYYASPGHPRGSSDSALKSLLLSSIKISS